MPNQRATRKAAYHDAGPTQASSVAPGKRTRAEEGAQGSLGDASSSPAAGAAAPASMQRSEGWVMDSGSLAAMGLGTACDGSEDVAATSTQAERTPVARPRAAGRVSTGNEGSMLMGSLSELVPPTPGINRIAFIDHGDGAFVRTGPAEAGSPLLRAQPLPPATRLFVSGVHPAAPQWWYVTAFLPGEVVRGYVQDLRVATDLPEPAAKLYQIEGGDTVERLAVREFSSAVRDGQDLRYYENVLLKVNRDRGRSGITGKYQEPGVLGGGANNIQLVAGHRIWLVNPAYARILEGLVPDGSLTNGALAKTRRFVGRLEDLLASVTTSPLYLDEVAGEFARSIRDHLAEVIGITAAFLVAESVSIAAAATPTGAGQLLAFLIQSLLAVLGAAGMVEASRAALDHGSQWMRLAWTAGGVEETIATASREFLRMLVALAMAALALKGAEASVGKAAAILAGGGGPAMPALAIGMHTRAVHRTGVLLGPPNKAGGMGAAGGMMMEAKPPQDGEPTGQGSGTHRGPASSGAGAHSHDPAASVSSPATSGVVEVARHVTRGDLAAGMELDPGKVAVFRGGRSLKLKPGETKIDPITKLAKPTHGPSLDVNPDTVARFGGAHRIVHIPPELKIVQRGSRLEHFELVPREPISEVAFQDLLDKVVVE